LTINDFIKSGGVVVRITLWDIAIKMFLDNYIFGAGLGGFETNFYSTLGAQLHYPHNIILEVLSELGIIGFILFCIVFVLTLLKLKNYSIKIFILFLFSFYLALFSKDLSSNPFLFSFVFYYVDKESSGIG
jgi:O-antigen ligase